MKLRKVPVESATTLSTSRTNLFHSSHCRISPRNFAIFSFNFPKDFEVCIWLRNDQKNFDVQSFNEYTSEQEIEINLLLFKEKSQGKEFFLGQVYAPNFC